MRLEQRDERRHGARRGHLASPNHQSVKEFGDAFQHRARRPFPTSNCRTASTRLSIHLGGSNVSLEPRRRPPSATTSLSDLRKGVGGARVVDDVDGADLSGVNGTPTFFIDARRHYGAYDIDTLSQAVRAAGARAMFAQT